MATARDVITDALRELGVLAAGETATTDDADSGLQSLNRLIDQWAAESLLIYSETRTETAVVPSQASYTVGAGGDINVAWPRFLEDVRWQDTTPSPDAEYPLRKLTDRDWQRLGQKDLTSVYPSEYYYNPTFPFGTLWLWPIPTGTTLQIVTYHKAAVAEFTALNTVLSLPPGYRRMLVKNLALDLAPSYGKQVDGALVEAARESLAVVQRANRRLRDLTFPPDSLIGGGRSGYDIRQG